ncbi:aldo/keto reductase [Nocardioides marmorisolisilvae]|uniref:Aldo/keto reductase n=1 Tax=Nocardioides marmorisolisilvae TaxID=1542737 RepID=A0A3N0DQL7_9ACTN|nr:aldo/keto reductase [Nocardioides marmorisolisilvae]RNL77633.1 aldo/keto reductase [Nocardioides marmorisolisilvae]
MAFSPRLSPLTETQGRLPALGLGCAPIADLFGTVSEEDALGTVRAALECGIRFLDTAPHYGAGLSERRVGDAIRGVPRDTITIASKAGRRIVDADDRDVPVGAVGVRTLPDLSYDGAMRSLESSLVRIGVDRIDLVYMHDPEDVDAALDGAFRALVRMREEGVVRAVGVGMNYCAPLARFVRESSADVVMEAGRLTLLDDSARDELLPSARDHGVDIVAAGVFNSGILADPAVNDRFHYAAAPDEVVRRARALQARCAGYGVPLAAAAVQFPLRFDPVAAVVVGATTPGEVRELVRNAAVDVPDDLWDQLGR